MCQGVGVPHQVAKTIRVVVCRAAIKVLGRLGAPAVGVLIARLKKDSDESVRRAAGLALGKTGSAAIDPLLALLSKGNVERDICIKALEAIGEANMSVPQRALFLVSAGRSAAAVRLGPEAVEPLMKLVEDPHPYPLNPYALEHAILALGGLGDARAVDKLISLYRRTPYYGHGHVEVITALGSLPTPQSIGFLADILKSGSEYKGVATGSLIRIGAPAVETLFALMSHPSDQAEQHAAVAPGADDVMRRIFALDAKRHAAIALGKLGDVRALEPLLHWLKIDADRNEEGEWGLARTDAEAINRIDPAALTPEQWIRYGCLDPEGSGKVSYQAEKAIDDMGDAAIPILLGMFECRSWVVRLSAACKLARIRTPASVDALIRLLPQANENSDTVRMAIIEVLGESGDIRAVGAILTAWQRRYCARAAVSALRAIGLEKMTREQRALFDELHRRDGL